MGETSREENESSQEQKETKRKLLEAQISQKLRYLRDLYEAIKKSSEHDPSGGDPVENKRLYKLAADLLDLQYED